MKYHSYNISKVVWGLSSDYLKPTMNRYCHSNYTYVIPSLIRPNQNTCNECMCYSYPFCKCKKCTNGKMHFKINYEGTAIRVPEWYSECGICDFVYNPNEYEECPECTRCLREHENCIERPCERCKNENENE